MTLPGRQDLFQIQSVGPAATERIRLIRSTLEQLAVLIGVILTQNMDDNDNDPVSFALLVLIVYGLIGQRGSFLVITTRSAMLILGHPFTSVGPSVEMERLTLERSVTMVTCSTETVARVFAR